MGWRENGIFGLLEVEKDIRPQSHITTGLGVKVAGVDVPADADIAEGQAYIYFDGTDIKAKRKISGTVTTATLNGAWA